MAKSKLQLNMEAKIESLREEATNHEAEAEVSIDLAVDATKMANLLQAEIDEVTGADAPVELELEEEGGEETDGDGPL